MRQEVTDEFLYQYMPQAEEAWIGAIEKQAEEGHVYSRRFEKKMKRILKDGSRSSTMRRVMRMGRRARSREEAIPARRSSAGTWPVTGIFEINRIE